MQAKILETKSELLSGFPVLRQLRTGLDEDTFFRTYTEAHQNDHYSLIGFFEEGSCRGVMGVRVLHDFVHGKHLYIDDLVVVESFRSKGLGAQMLKLAEKMSFEMGCQVMRLCTGLDNDAGKKFYDREGWQFRAVVYKKPTPLEFSVENGDIALV